MKATVENVAKVLLKNNVSFNYDNNRLVVTDVNVKYSLFEVASYHLSNGSLILMTTDCTKGISFEQFLQHFTR
jgi:hypothetical protein